MFLPCKTAAITTPFLGVLYDLGLLYTNIPNVLHFGLSLPSSPPTNRGKASYVEARLYQQRGF